MMRVAVYTGLMVLLVLNFTEAQNGSRQRTEGRKTDRSQQPGSRQRTDTRERTDERKQNWGREGRGKGRGSQRCTNQTNISVRPCWTGYISCPADSVIQVESVNCKERCTRGKPAVCVDETLQTAIEANCNGLRECSVQGVTGVTCSELKTVVYVKWSCGTTIPIV